MLRRIASKLRPSPSMCVSMLALCIALGGAGVAATGGNFILGRDNTATSRSTLTASVPGVSTLWAINNSTAAGSSALALNVAAGNPPMKVNSTVKVVNFHADLLDGYEANAFLLRSTERWRYINDIGEPPFLHGWQVFENTQNTYAFPSFRKDSEGTVHLRGIIKAGASTQGGQPFFDLPRSHCPRTNKIFAVVGYNEFQRVTVNKASPAGCSVFANLVRFNWGWISLDGISFPSEAYDY